MDYPKTKDLHNGKFTDGDPITGIPASIASAEHMNALYDELINLLEGAEITPDVAKDNQLLDAINYYRNASNMIEGTIPIERLPITPASKSDILAGASSTVYVTPKGLDETGLLSDYVGSVHWFATQQTPAGFIKANGAEISRTDYANLFAKIGITFGGGDGVDTFNVPDLRGEFIRGWDDGRGVDAGRELGSWQEDEFKSHSHYVGMNSWRVEGDQGWSLRPAGSENSATSSYSGGDETRPRNIALAAFIKY